MPKFLDVPSWYTTDGTLVSAWTEKPGYATVLKGNSDGTCKWERPAVSYCNGSMNGGHIIFAPTSGGNSGQILTSNGNSAPIWSDNDKFKKVININSALNTTSPVTLKATSSADILNHLLFLGIKLFGGTAANLLFPIGYAITSLQNTRFSIIMPLASGTASSVYISCWNATFCPLSTNYAGLEIENTWGGVFTFSSNPSWTPGAPAGLYFDAIYSL